MLIDPHIFVWIMSLVAYHVISVAEAMRLIIEYAHY